MSESYLIGGDTLQSVDHPNRQGQTFRVEEKHVLNFIDLEMRGSMVVNQPLVQVKYADGSHEPFGPTLSRNRYIVEKKSGLFTTGRVRFSMQPHILDPIDYYALVVSNFPSLGGDIASWQYDKDDGAYPRGHRIFSPDGGATWSQHFFDDCMFAEFGNPPLLKSEPAPPIDNFAAVDITYLHHPTSITFTLATSVPCHLFCYYTDKKPLKHPSTRVVRGLITPWGTYFCFVAWKIVEQTEPGDTLYHTFEMPDWVYCQTKWFTFRGTIDSSLSPSIGPIFEKHFQLIENIEDQLLFDTTTGMNLGGHDEKCGQLLTITNRTVTQLSFPLSKLNNPTGDVILGILKESDKSLICSKLWGPASNLPIHPALTWAVVEFDDPKFINDLAIIYIQVTGGDSANQVVAYFMNSDVKPHENRVRYNGASDLWMQDTLADAAYRYHYY